MKYLKLGHKDSPSYIVLGLIEDDATWLAVKEHALGEDQEGAYTLEVIEMTVTEFAMLHEFEGF